MSCSLGSGRPAVCLCPRYERRGADTTPSGGKLHAGLGVAAVTMGTLARGREASRPDLPMSGHLLSCARGLQPRP